MGLVGVGARSEGVWVGHSAERTTVCIWYLVCNFILLTILCFRCRGPFWIKNFRSARHLPFFLSGLLRLGLVSGREGTSFSPFGSWIGRVYT